MLVTQGEAGETMGVPSEIASLILAVVTVFIVIGFMFDLFPVEEVDEQAAPVILYNAARGAES
ncbi:hypothetical protein [Shouchella shacheensis]|uniref:hypothetical protein n=1 Tax=Shouchella shacheensis TaxID=1649580 RepID=UPI00073FCA8F|nr:hypothetical protein [Shouchella shacheensis]